MAKCREFGHKFNADDDFWAGVEEIVTVLKPAYNFTVDMQRIGYGLADFYIGWLRLKKNCERFVKDDQQFNLAAKLLEHMNWRAPSLFDTPLFLCAVYLDPRMMFSLSPNQKAEAAMSLNDINSRLKEANNSEHRVNTTLDEIREECMRTAQLNGNQNTEENLIQTMSRYEMENACDIRAPVMQFWMKNREKYPLLSPLADILHAVPANQCCTERSFSGFSYIRSKHRMSMKPQNVSNVLTIRLNKDVYYLLRNERVQKILSKND